MNLTTHPQTQTATSRRALLRASAATAAVASVAGTGLIAGASSASATTPTPSTRPSTAAAALAALSAGNQRWRTQHQQHPHESNAVRQQLVSGQSPFALILGCIDSRVPPELVFDQGLGDLMTVRSAGEVLDEAVLGSVAYGVLELGIPLVLVLGHQSCGAVAAAVHAEETGASLPDHIQYIADQIEPAIDHTQHGDARVDSTISRQVNLVRSRLAAEPDLAAKVSAGTLQIVGARYELNTQLVHRIS
ncbi:carbonic anhydrase [Streptomyces sp. NBC_01498]|uniref:carbonic anhydrase n=1 Tax=Streptomyces sp. NBC_01498 TaxID=2975870 RepID=UPI002E7C369B|nr:carbonic anhydrase [Streptomyces sp. NBC_01498]WTL28508.1 carbonic anhydrase [Streptomyces sp. NBC_01498]